jgi:hypothetical protein
VFGDVAPGEPIPFGLALAAAFIEHALARMPQLGDWGQLLDRVYVLRITRGLRQSLRLSNEVSDDVEGALFGLETLLRSQEPSVATLKRFLARRTAPLSRALLDALARRGLTPEGTTRLQHRLAELEATDYAPPPLVTGDDLTAAGFSPGPNFKRVLDDVYDAQLEGRAANKAEAMELASRAFAQRKEGGR